MERAQLTNGDGQLSSVSSASGGAAKSRKHAAPSDGEAALRKKAKPANTKPGPPLRKKTGTRPKEEKLVCRYCGSDNLAPSFIKRRDRRCRKCFSKRYGSAAPAKKPPTRK